jgi:putative SOS response-associated peptidase YedK
MSLSPCIPTPCLSCCWAKADIETWLTAPTDEALKLQKPAPDDAVVVLPEERKAARSSLI